MTSATRMVICNSSLALRPYLAILLCILCTLLTATVSAAQPATGFVDAPVGGRLWYEAKGEGTPIVFLHDGLVASATWDRPFDDFAKGFRVVRYDRRGFGRSEPPKSPYSDVDDLQAVLETLKIGRAVLIGCSNGSRLAVDYTLAHPDRVEALVLVGPVVSGLPYSEHFQRRGLVNFRPMFREKSRQKLIEAWVQDPYLTDPHDAEGKARLRELLTKNPGPLTANVPESKAPDRPAVGRLAEIHVPTLIAVGASDIPDVHAHAGALEAGIQGSRRVVFPGAGHLVQLDQPEALDREILLFLRPEEVARRELARTPETQPDPRLFDYDAKAPLDVQEAGTERRGDVRIIDVSYASPLGGRVPAYLILPPGAGKHPAVLFLHPGQGSRSTFVDEAVSLAKEHGFVSLAISAPFLRPENQGKRGGNPWNPEVSRREQIQTVVDLRRGFDLLVSRPEADLRRLAYVGHSLGATVGGTLAGIEKRPVAFVLMGGYPSLTHNTAHGTDQGALAFQELLTPEQQKAYVDALEPLDALHYIGHAAPARLLFQFAKRDEFISPWDAAVYVQAASEPREVKWYDTDHAFNEKARRDQDEWLGRVLKGPS